MRSYEDRCEVGQSASAAAGLVRFGRLLYSLLYNGLKSRSLGWRAGVSDGVPPAGNSGKRDLVGDEHIARGCTDPKSGSFDATTCSPPISCGLHLFAGERQRLPEVDSY